MKTLLNFALTTILLGVMIILPLVAFGHMVNEMTEAVPHFASPIQEAEYWRQAFGQ